jgi:hypothetical protein
MASNERSLGWNTSTSNDGATTYDSARMIAMELKTLGNGILLHGSNLFVTGASTTLTIADGAALINGYFYESTSASTIPTSTLNGNYTLALIANASGSSYTVARSTADTTTVLTNTVRMALATSAQLTTIGAANYISIASVTVGATGIITSLTNLYAYAASRIHPATQSAYLRGGTATLTDANTFYDVNNYASGNSSADGTIVVNTSSGEIKILRSGVYTFSCLLHFDTNTSGNRIVQIQNLDWQFMNGVAVNMQQFGVAVFTASATLPITVTPGTSLQYYLQAFASVTGRSVTDSQISITRV